MSISTIFPRLTMKPTTASGLLPVSPWQDSNLQSRMCWVCSGCRGSAESGVRVLPAKRGWWIAVRPVTLWESAPLERTKKLRSTCSAG
jgi:hypothetical protein